MRLWCNALLALPALLSAFVVAVPSPAAYFQQPLDEDVQQRQQPRWRSISDRVIESVWGLGEKRKESASLSTRRSRNSAADQSLPQQTLSRYGDDVVLRFNLTTPEEAQSLAEAADALLLDIWDFTHHWVDIRLSKSTIPFLLALLPPSFQHSHTPLFHDHDLALAISNTYPKRQQAQTTSALSHFRDRQISPLLQHSTDPEESVIFFQEYRPLSVIEPWMRFLSRVFSTHVTLINIGLSYEGRDILGLRVGHHPTPTNNDNPSEQPKRKTVLITGGLHAREWISTSTVSYIAFHLITAYGKNPKVTNLLQEYDFVLVPTVNPDGYAYTWERDRLWRKNRQRTTVRFCTGMDLDRGFGFEWDTTTATSSTVGNPCSESYAGATPFEAVESRRLADWARNETQENNVEFVGFLDLHSYSQQILYPYSYSCDATPPSQENLEELALGLEKAIRRSSSMVYESMAACEGNYNYDNNNNNNGDGKLFLPRMEDAGGSALDWFYHELHVKYAYQIKLRDRGTYGFLLPKENIVPTGKEMLEAVMYLGEFLKDGYPKMDLKGGEEAEEDGEEEKVAVNESNRDGLDDEWVVVEDLDLAVAENDEERNWDLRRRRRR